MTGGATPGQHWQTGCTRTSTAAWPSLGPWVWALILKHHRLWHGVQSPWLPCPLDSPLHRAPPVFTQKRAQEPFYKQGPELRGTYLSSQRSQVRGRLTHCHQAPTLSPAWGGWAHWHSQPPPAPMERLPQPHSKDAKIEVQGPPQGPECQDFPSRPPDPQT